jgi:tRNA-2-methylthio-N6-dimethylallyladenosine synthase
VRSRRREPERWRARDLRLAATDMDAEVRFEGAAEAHPGGLHAWMAVMRGCDLSCSFCIVPTTRGRVRSRPIGDLLEEARALVERGVRAITLLGQTVNSYGEDFPVPGPGEGRGSGRQGRPGLADLVRRLQELDGLARLRLVTLHPSYLGPALAEAMRDCDKLERFLPLPAQSGSDGVLRAMRRGYTTDLYRRRVEVLREAVPDVELASDWIVGYPGESEEDFARSEAFLDEQGFAVNYVFKYDPRPGTSSAERTLDDVPEASKRERNRRLLAKAEEVGLRLHAAFLGRTVEVFVEERCEEEPGALRGRSLHGLAVRLAGGDELLGRKLEVEIERATAWGLGGRPLLPEA